MGFIKPDPNSVEGKALNTGDEVTLKRIRVARREADQELIWVESWYASVKVPGRLTRRATA